MPARLSASDQDNSVCGELRGFNNSSCGSLLKVEAGKADR
jgi:hypothetical protein